MSAVAVVRDAADPQDLAGPLRVALIGNPNAGKSTLFNALTGLRQQVANFPGVTVERVEGSFAHGGRRVIVTDLPGTYGLTADSPDERIAVDVLLGRIHGVPAPDVTVVVVDAENIERHLFLASEVLDLGRPTVIALNRMDRLTASGWQIDIPELIHELGAVVVPVVASRGEGIDRLRHAIAVAKSLPLPVARGPVSVEARYARIGEVVARCAPRPAIGRRTASDRVDRVALHPVWGPLIFVVIMALMFQTMFTWARPLTGSIEWVMAWLASGLTRVIPAGEFRSLLVDGVVGGVGSVLVFVPQIAILFTFIGLLEDSGYMARAAFVMDRFMRPVGLHGRSFIPLLSGYACAVPAILATRTIKDPKQRMATILVVPLISCSARLPVYALLIGAFVPSVAVMHGVLNLQGLTLLGMYLLGTIGALAAAAVFRQTLLRGATRALILEMPSYSLPNTRVLSMSVWLRIKVFLQRAGTVILAASVVLWALAQYPKSPDPHASSEARLAYSALGRVGKVLEPAARPLGFDWKISVSVASSFAAREVFVSTMATIYGVDEQSGGGRTAALSAELRQARNSHGEASYTPIIALALMAFYVFALMCTSTTAVTVRETGGGRTGAAWAALQFMYMLLLAYGVAYLVYHGGKAVGFA